MYDYPRESLRGVLDFGKSLPTGQHGRRLNVGIARYSTFVANLHINPMLEFLRQRVIGQAHEMVMDSNEVLGTASMH